MTPPVVEIRPKKNDRHLIIRADDEGSLKELSYAMYSGDIVAEFPNSGWESIELQCENSIQNSNQGLLFRQNGDNRQRTAPPKSMRYVVLPIDSNPVTVCVKAVNLAGLTKVGYQVLK